MPSPSHQIRSLVSTISSEHDTTSVVVALEERLSGVRASPKTSRPRPLFGPPVTDLDMAAPEVRARLEEARMGAMREVQEVNRLELSQLTERYAATFMKMEEAIASIPNVVTTEVVDLALLVAQEIVHAELSTKPELVTNAVERALASVPQDGTITLRMNPEDLEGVKSHLDENTTRTIHWSADSALRRGDCIVEMPDRVVDASIQARFNAVREVLVRTLMAKEQETDS